MWNKIDFSPEHIENILNLYTIQNISISKIAKLYQVNDSVISRVLKENNIQIRTNNFYKQKRFDETFFDVIDTEEKAYWLGFIYADGCVSHRENTDVFEIKLSETDKTHLEKLKLSLQSEHCIGTYTSTSGYNIDKTYCSISIVNQHLVDALIKSGVTYQKTHNLKFPTTTQVPNGLIRHFIRGYFDGDGSVYCTQSDNKGCISFTGTENMLNGILNEIKTMISTNVSLYKYKDKDIYDLKIGGNNYFKQCYEFLYNDATIFLDRKKNKFDEILNK